MRNKEGNQMKKERKPRWSAKQKRHAKDLLRNPFSNQQSQKSFYTIRFSDADEFGSRLKRKVSRMHDRYANGQVLIGSNWLSARTVELIQSK